MDPATTNAASQPSKLTISPASISFGNVESGTSGSQTITLDNTGRGSVTVSQVNVTGTGFTASGLSLPVTLAAGQTLSFSAVFSPKTAGSVSGAVSLVSNASNSPATVSLSGTGLAPSSSGAGSTSGAGAPAQVSVTPASLNFGTIEVGAHSTQTLTLSNTGTSAVTVSQAIATGTGFTLSGPSLPLTLAGGERTSFSVAFAPTTAGNVTGSVSILNNASNATLTIPLSGQGVTMLIALSPSNLNFGSVSVGGNSTQTLTIGNVGTVAVTISQATITGAGFNLGSISLPLNLQAGQSAAVNVSFAPSSAGSSTGNVSIVSNAANSPAVVPLSGTAGTFQLTAAPTSVSFGNITVGNSGIQAITLTNTGTSPVTVSQASATGTGFGLSRLSLPLTLAAGQSTSFTASFSPTAAANETGSISIVSDASNSPLSIPLAGTGVTLQIAASPSRLDFGTVAVGGSSTQAVTLSNTGTASITVSQATPTGSGFSLSGLSLPMTLAAGQSTSFSATFAPPGAGSATGSISVVSDASNSPLSISLAGTGGNLQVAASPTSVSFGNITVGNSGIQAITLTNTGTSPVTVSQASATGTGFGLSRLSLPLTLSAGQSTSFTASFSPTAAANETGSISIVSDASNSPLSIPLAGTGVTLQIAASPSRLDFGTVAVGGSSTQAVTLSNTGTASITVSQATPTGSGFSLSGLSLPMPLAAGQSTSFNATFAPPGAGSATGSITVVSDASNSPLSISLAATGGTLQVAASPTSVNFNNVTVGSQTTQTVTLSNSGNSTLTVSQVTASGAGFSLSGLSLPVTLTSGQSASFIAAFLPTVAGGATGSISVVSNASNSPLTVPLSGTGVSLTLSALSASPSSLSFGNITVGSSSALPVVMTNTGSSSVTVSQTATSGSGFSVTAPSLPLTLAAGQNTSFSVTFDPSAAGSVTGNLSVVSNATNSPTVVSLSATGVNQHSVTLTWVASTSPNIMGYNVYRGMVSGGPYTKLDSTLVAGTSYTDTTVQAGQTYYYVTTAVDSQGVESADSNQAAALIPFP